MKWDYSEALLWWDALWLSLDELHKSPSRWKDWNDVEDFLMPWIQDLAERMDLS